MKTSFILVLIWLFEAQAKLVFKQLAESQTLELSWGSQQDHSSTAGLHLYHRSAQGQTTLLSMAESGELRINPEHKGRLQLSGGLDNLRVNVTLSHLQPSDTGLYLWELSHGENVSHQILLSAHKVFLLVEGTGKLCQCSLRYAPLHYTIFPAAGLLLLTLGWLAAEKCVESKCRHRPQPSAPIYEEMTRKQQSAKIPQNNHEAQSHLEEVDFPVYANQNIRQPQDNYYACPRQLSLERHLH